MNLTPRHLALACFIGCIVLTIAMAGVTNGWTEAVGIAAIWVGFIAVVDKRVPYRLLLLGGAVTVYVVSDEASSIRCGKPHVPFQHIWARLIAISAIGVLIWWIRKHKPALK